MGCRSDHMKPTAFEIELSTVVAHLAELETEDVVPRTWYQGNHPEVYSKNRTQDELDTLTLLLCAKLEDLETETLDCTLELQFWWRNHQEQDTKREAEEARLKKPDKTPYIEDFSADYQISGEEAIAALLEVHQERHFGGRPFGEEECAEFSRDCLYIVLRNFRTDLFVDCL